MTPILGVILLFALLLNYETESFFPICGSDNDFAVARTKAFNEDYFFVAAWITHNSYLQVKATGNLEVREYCMFSN